MKRTLFLILLMCLAATWPAQNVWTVKTVPNTRLESDFIHVSDPDDILSDSCEQLINTALNDIRDQADVFIVALGSIGDADIEIFANELFNYWGIGDRETNNGVLILLAKEQRQLKFETGYGVEETLTDARCQMIFENDIVPFFKEGDYQSGLCSGVTQVVEVFGGAVPDGLITILPQKRETDEGGSESGEDAPLSFILLGLLMFFMPIVGLVSYAHSDRYATKVSTLLEQATIVDGVRYIDGDQKQWDGNPWGGVGCLKALMYGLSIFIFMALAFVFETVRVGSGGDPNIWLVLLYTLVMYFTWVCFRQNSRALKASKKLAKTSLQPQKVYEQACNNKLTKFTRWLAPWLGWIYTLVFKHKIQQSDGCPCAECGRELHDFSHFRFNPVQMKELELHSVQYKPYTCELGHVTMVKTVKDKRYHVCPVCHGRTERAVNTKVVEQCSYEKSGLKEVTYHCEYCNRVRVVQEIIPRLYRSISGSTSGHYTSSSSSRSYHHSSSSHRSGGSFGGGRSGGGGFKGGW